MTDFDVAIIGAGPYGLSAAAHLGDLKGLSVRVFGEPMSFWERHMPAGMLLRSPWAGSHLSDPKRALTLDKYRATNGNYFAAPVPLANFVQYGRWFQCQVVPDVDARQVTRVGLNGRSFQLTLADGQLVTAKRVVIATGIASFAYRPKVFKGLPLALVSHSSEHRDLGKLKDKKVLVVGAGQSALESAALIHEAGGNVQVLLRSSGIRWLHQRRWAHTWPIEPILYAPPDVGAALVSHLVARPNLYKRLPRRWQDEWGVSSIRPAGARWLQARFNGIPVCTRGSVVGLKEKGAQVKVQLQDGTEQIVDHILLGTGYRVDIAQCPFLDQNLLKSIDRINGFPQLDAGFESSVPALHFVGAPAAWSFGPLMRFVAGVEFASCALARRVKSQTSPMRP